MGRFLLRVLGAMVLTTAIAYAGDYLLRYRIARNQAPFATVTVHPYLAVPQKDHKTEFLFDDPRDETCVNTLFPHMGDSPCWYLRRHTEQRTDM